MDDEQILKYRQTGQGQLDFLAEEYPEVIEELRRFGPGLLASKLRYSDFLRDRILPLLPPQYHIKILHFVTWSKKKMKELGITPELEAPMNLMDREIEKQKQQIIIRQDTTDLMANWLKVLKSLTNNPDSLKKYNGQQILSLYKIIREEEDRSKLLSLRERAEDRADAAFSFLVSIARAGELLDADIEFLSDDIKKELLTLKQENGIYKLPDTELIPQIAIAAKNADSFADGSDSEGAI